MKVLLYIKRSVQDKDGFSPLMGRISVRGKVNSIAQFACKFKIDVRLWNATAQRCTGKSKSATMANREIERVLLLLQKRFNELSDIRDVVKAEEVRNVFQGLAETQDTIMKLYAEHNSDYALRVGVNRAASTFYRISSLEKLIIKFLNSADSSSSCHGISSLSLPIRPSTPARHTFVGRSKKNTVSHSLKRISSVLP